MTRFKVPLAVLLIAALTGILAGRYYSQAVAGIAQAQGDKPTESQPLEWADLNVVYLGPATLTGLKGLSSADLATSINAQTITNVDDVMKFSQQNGLDILIFDKTMLAHISSTWAKAQYQRGTAFVGVNVTAKELGALIDDQDFAEWGIATWSEPFVSYTVVRASGNPAHIKILQEHNALYPPDVVLQAKLGINDVDLMFVRAYGPVPGEGLVYDLETIRANLFGLERVAPYQP